MSKKFTNEQKDQIIDRYKRLCDVSETVKEFKGLSSHTLVYWLKEYEIDNYVFIPHIVTRDKKVAAYREELINLTLQKAEMPSTVDDEETSNLCAEFKSALVCWAPMCVYTSEIWESCLSSLEEYTYEEVAHMFDIPLNQVAKYVLVYRYSSVVWRYLIKCAKRYCNCQTVSDIASVTFLKYSLIRKELERTNSLLYFDRI